MFSAPHTATVRRMVLTYTISYSGGSAAFTPGKTLTGATSHATATILSTGSSVASGTLTIFNISGTFQNGEVLSDDGTVPGAASSASLTSQALDKYGQPSKTYIDTSTACRLFNPVNAYPETGKSYYAYVDMQVLLPPEVLVEEGDFLISTVTGYSGTFSLYNINPTTMLGKLHHWGAACKVVL